MKFAYLIFICIIIFVQPCFTQRGVSTELFRQIGNDIQVLIGDNYELAHLISVDNERPASTISGVRISKLNQPLSGAYIFTVLGNSIDNINMYHRGFIGVYKDNQIIWRSDTVINDNDFIRHAYVEGVMDLNNDGKMEIITLWCELPSGPQYLWIFSWDGAKGTLINDIDENGQSVIVSIPQYFLINDLNGDGIWEINGRWSNDINIEHVDSKVIYSWNGQKYGKWSSAPQLPASGFLPRNKVNVSINAHVEKTDSDNYKYVYKVTNSKTSFQEIDEFRINNSINKVSSQGGRRSWGNWFGDYNLIGWGDMVVGNFIERGETDSSFYYITSGLPAIENYYVRGYNAKDYDTSEFDNVKSYEDLLINSVIGFTIGPSDPTEPFDVKSSIDTLLSFTIHSSGLGWITSQPTMDKYLNYFNSVRINIQQNNILSARAVLNNVLHDVDIDSSSTLTSEAYALLRYNTEYLLSKIPLPPSGAIIKLVNSTGVRLTTGTLQYYEGSWKDAVNNNDGTFTVNTTQKTVSLRMTYEYGTQTKSNVTVTSDTIVFQTVNAQIKLQNSRGNPIDTGTVQYYAGAWRTFGSTWNGTASKELLPGTYSFRMTYAYASKDQQQDIGVNPAVIFQTVNTSVQLKNSLGSLIDQGTVQYYSGAWRDFGTTINGTANKELLPNSYSFRMTYAYAIKDKQQDIGTDPIVVFQTVNAAVQLQNSIGSLIDQGTVQYYSGAWRDFGTTLNGVANRELLPNNYSFRMTYAYASKDKQQDIGMNTIVVFQTVNAAVQLQNSQGNLIDPGTVQYYSGAWRDFGSTINGTATKELLPNNYSFRMTYAYASKDKQQDLSSNPVVVFQTVNANVQLQNSQGTAIDTGTVQYYSGAWRTFGTTVNGIATIELLPNNYSFRMTYAYASKDKQQDLNSNPIVVFQTVNAAVQLRNSQDNLIDQGSVQYYSGAWRSLGTTTNGTAYKELLPNSYSFRMTNEYISNDKTQDLSTNNTVSFSTVLCTIRVKNAQSQPVDNVLASYYSGAWRQIGLTVNGEVTKELLPANLTFRVKLGTVQQDKTQNLSTNNVVEFILP